MVLMPSTLEGRVLSLESKALAAGDLLVVGFTGTEAISSPYAFQIDLVSPKADIDSAAMLQNRAWLGIKQGITVAGGKRGIHKVKIHGILDSFEQWERGKDWTAYRAILVPRISRLALNVRTAIYLDQTVPEIVAGVLEAGGLTSDDYLFLTNAREYAKREYVVQYQESDLDFVSRLLEEEGICYYFLHGEEFEKAIFADSADVYSPIRGDSGLAVAKTDVGASWFDPERVFKFVSRHRIAPKEVVYKDYNYRTPSVDLTVTMPASGQGTGTVYEYGRHYKDSDQGKVYAQIRAEEFVCREKTFWGESEGRAFRAGSVFTLMGHYRDDWNADYLITEVVHRAEQTLGFGRPGTPQAAYRNEFSCVPAATVFRPKRVTPQPKIPGTMHAKIDAAGDGTYAELDDQGRYRVQIPFDLSGNGGGIASRPIRMAQPYAGPDFGLHLPLHKGTEVILTHINGDPDRPIIAGAVPNPETPSPVKDANQTQAILKSAANNSILLEDQKDAERLLIRAQKDLEFRIVNDVRELVQHDRHLIVTNDRLEQVDRDHHEKIGRDHNHEIGGNRSLTLTGNEAVDIGGKSSLTIEGDVARVYLANHSKEIAGDSYVKANQIVLEASSGLSFVCGGSSVVIDSSGVTVTGSAVTIDGGTTKVNSGAGTAPAEGALLEAATPVAATAPLEPGDVSASGATSSSAGTTQKLGAAEKKSWITIVLKDKKGKPIPREMYEVSFPDGTVIRGRLDKDGKATVKGIPAGAGEVTFPRMDKGGWEKG